MESKRMFDREVWRDSKGNLMVVEFLVNNTTRITYYTKDGDPSIRPEITNTDEYCRGNGYEQIAEKGKR